MNSHAHTAKNGDGQGASAISDQGRHDVKLFRPLQRSSFPWSGLPATHMNSNAGTSHLAQIQEMADRSPQVQSLVQFQAIVSPGEEKATPANDDQNLEHEADVTGPKAAQAPAQELVPGPAQKADLPTVNPVRSAQSPVQAKWILRNGKRVWVDDPYVLQPGESDAPLPPYFQQRPSVIVSSGQQEVTLDSSGKASVNPLKRKPDPHPKLQNEREKQGAEIRKRLKADPKRISQATGVVKGLADELEKNFAGDLAKNHAEKVKKAYSRGPISGKDFRAITPALDELTQSEASSAQDQGLRRHRGGTPPPDRQKIAEFEQQALRAQSSFRAPTRTIVFPTDIGGKITGQQHPTSKDQPKLQGGSSGHSYADRRRVQSQVTAFDESAQDADAPPEVLLLSSMLAAGIATLSQMSAPLSASNLPSFNPSALEQQRQEREKIKKAVNLIASKLGVPVLTGEQDFDAPFQPHQAPSSPRRLDRAETVEARKKRAKSSQQVPLSSTPDPSKLALKPSPSVPDSGSVTAKPSPQTSNLSPALTSLPIVIDPSAKTLPPSPSTVPIKKFSSEEVEDYQRLHDTLSHTFVELVIATDLHELHAAGAQDYFDQLLGLQAALTQIDRNDPAQLGAVEALYQHAYNWFVYLRHFVTRRQVGQASPANDSLGARGRRWPSLRQFFSECGQMAAYNVLALAGNIDDALAEDALTNLGAFGNNIGEGNIRAILEAVHRTDIPVIGSLEQMHDLVDLLGDENYAALVQDFQVDDAEFSGLQQVAAFRWGDTDALNAVVNTTGHLGAEERGHHWIAVRFRRREDGQITINYLDSFDADTDYTGLFTNYRQFFGHVPPNH
jgi:hypothetical protein